MSTSGKRRPATQTTPLTDQLDAIFGPLRERMIRRHVDEARARAIRDHILTDDELAALARNGIELR